MTPLLSDSSQVGGRIRPHARRLRDLGAEIRAGIIERLCSDLDLDEDDLRAVLREEIQSEIEDSVVNDADEILKERLFCQTATRLP